MIALLLAIGGVLIWRFGPTAAQPHLRLAIAAPATSTASPAAPTPAAEPIPAKSIAVLPFENLSADKKNAYFVAGMQDLILTKLADIGDLKVISRTSTAKYASHPNRLKTIAQQLGVATILEGCVQKAGNQVLINVQLIDAATDSHIWAKSYQRTLDNIFGVEGAVAEKVAKALNAKLTAAETAAIAKVPTHNKNAYQALLKAAYYLNDSNRTLDRSELEKSARLAQQAIKFDPKFVHAYNLLALAYNKLGGHADEVVAASRRALGLDPRDAGAHMELGFVLMGKGNFADAITEAKKAVHLSPDWQKIAGLAVVYGGAGRFATATAAYRRAMKLVPKGDAALRDLGDGNLAGVFAAQRRYAEARAILQRAAARDPADVAIAAQLANVT